MKTIAFPRIHKEKNEKRDFLPDFFRLLKNDNSNFYLEDNYGIGLGFSKEDYLNANPNIEFITHEECFKKDIVMVLRSPETHEIESMKEGSMLISMLHYHTRRSRTDLLKQKNIFCISLDSIRNDSLERLVVDYKSTSSNGVGIAFTELEKNMPNFYSTRDTIKVTIIGVGNVALMAAKSAAKYGNNYIYDRIKDSDTKGVLIRLLPKNITKDRNELKDILIDTDILIDASARDDYSKFIIDNELIGYMKQNAIILDLSANPYLTDIEPMRVKAIEGIPTGSLDKMVFYTDDAAYEKIPKGVSTKNRRTVVSCSAWPGLKPMECMELYCKQILPIMNSVFEYGIEALKESSDNFFMRAAYRGTFDFFEKEIKK